MHYKEDWPKAKERFLAFWQSELIDRCCISVQAPRKNSHYQPSEPPESQNEYPVYHWDGLDAIKHLDTLLAIPEIDAIQWTLGEGQAKNSSCPL